MTYTDPAAKVWVAFIKMGIKFKVDIQGSDKHFMITCFLAQQYSNWLWFTDTLTEVNWQKWLVAFLSLNF